MTITLTPSGGDDYPQIMAALQSAAQNIELVLDYGTFLLSQPIVENVPGLIVRGKGHRVQGSGTGFTCGTVLKATHSGWTWTRANPTGSNEYRGAVMEGFALTGPVTAPGAMLVNSCYNTIYDVHAINYVANGARAFWNKAPGQAGGSSQENYFIDCGALNCWIGIESDSNDGAEIQGFMTLRNSQSPVQIHGQGYGAIIRDPSTRIIGGKWEGNATGILGAGQFLSIVGASFEDNANWDVELDRGTTATSGTENFVCALPSKVRVGPYNFGDRVLGLRYPRTFTDTPNPQGIAKGTKFF